jgi:hypothetical protein
MLILKQQYKQEIFRPMTLTADIQEQFGTIWKGKGSTGDSGVVFLFWFKKTAFMRRYTDKGRVRFVLYRGVQPTKWQAEVIYPVQQKTPLRLNLPQNPLSTDTAELPLSALNPSSIWPIHR